MKSARVGAFLLLLLAGCGGDQSTINKYHKNLDKTWTRGEIRFYPDDKKDYTKDSASHFPYHLKFDNKDYAEMSNEDGSDLRKGTYFVTADKLSVSFEPDSTHQFAWDLELGQLYVARKSFKGTSYTTTGRYVIEYEYKK